jgi:hypothetical protein
MNRSDNIQFHLAIIDTLSQILSFNQIKKSNKKIFDNKIITFREYGDFTHVIGRLFLKIGFVLI